WESGCRRKCKRRAWGNSGSGTADGDSILEDNNASSDTLGGGTGMRTALRTAFIAACALAFALPVAALAQSFPTKPITLICPWPAGGSTDLHLRKIADIASRHL